jgi:hypothetical protein
MARGIFSSRAQFCTEVATGAGATDSAGGNGCSRSSGSIVSPFERTLSRTGLVAVFAGEVDSVCWVECDEACGMLQLEVRIGSTRKPQGNTLLRIGDCGTNSILWADAGFGQSVITRVKVLAILQRKER